MDLRIPNNADPSPSFDQLAALFLHLKQNNLEIPKKLRVMIILSKMPPAYKAMVQMCVIAGEDGDQEPEQLIARFQSAWDTGNRMGGSNKPQHANKLSAVNQHQTNHQISNSSSSNSSKTISKGISSVDVEIGEGVEERVEEERSKNKSNSFNKLVRATPYHHYTEWEAW
jgi:hypothetical protein